EGGAMSRREVFGRFRQRLHESPPFLSRAYAQRSLSGHLAHRGFRGRQRPAARSNRPKLKDRGAEAGTMFSANLVSLEAEYGRVFGKPVSLLSTLAMLPSTIGSRASWARHRIARAL